MGGPAGPMNLNGWVALSECVGERRVLTGVSPTSPDCVDTVKAGQLDNERHIGVVVIVGATGNVDNHIAHANHED